MEIESKSGYRNSGRKAGEIQYRFVNYEGKEYCVGSLLFKEQFVEFVFDKEDYEKVSARSWHFASGNYISSAFVCGDGKRRELYLHNFVMGTNLFPGKGAKESVDHINRNGLDNRKENLRILSQSQQNLNQAKKKRNIILPENCGVQPEEIPKHIWYVKAQGHHGDRFAIEFKTEGICWKTTSSKQISLQAKLEQAKNKLLEFYEKYPYLNPNYEVQKQAELEKSFREILQS